MKKVIIYNSAAFLGLFGLLTLFLSTSVILDLFGIRAKEGNYVLFIVWANFISSLLYLFASFGFVKIRKWTYVPLAISTIILATAFVGLKLHISAGGIYELKTVSAMIFRTSITLVFTLIAYFTLSKKKP